MHRFMVTGGAGFIGSHIVERIKNIYPDSVITILDKMTYAADYRNILHLIDHDKVKLIVGDICNFELCKSILKNKDILIHLAAESHVDNSFGDSLLFTKTNTFGTHTLLEACRICKVPRIIHVSTDEIYGEVLTGEVDESSKLSPTNPYAASKASAEMLIKSYIKSYDIPVCTVRANNIFGIRQYPEKLIPRSILSIVNGEKIPVHGTGKYRRRFLAVQDFSEAIEIILEKGITGEVYNVGTRDEFENLEVINLICEHMDIDSDSAIEFVKDRPFNDQRYGISFDKIERLGWHPKHNLKDELSDIISWYRNNINRYIDNS